MKHPSELAERLLEHWRSTGMTLCVEAAAQIEAQRERIAWLAGTRCSSSNAMTSRPGATDSRISCRNLKRGNNEPRYNARAIPWN
jgi:hypothetical protein